MKKIYCLIIAFTIIIPYVISSCGNSSGEIVRIIEERDSLKHVASKQKKYMDNLGEIINLVNSSLDSIAAQENLIFPSISEGNISKDIVLSKVDGIANLIDKQRSEIERLEKKISEEQESDDNTADENIQQIINRFKLQLAEKDRQISILKEELSKKDADISGLQQKIGTYTRTIEELDRRNSLQTEALKRQDAMLNHCYMIIADKKQLQNNGIVKKGKIVPQGALDRTKFIKIDIRTFTETEFDAKRPRILTPMPENSYTLTTNGKNRYILKINNPTEFWRISNYLVIQTD